MTHPVRSTILTAAILAGGTALLPPTAGGPAVTVAQSAPNLDAAALLEEFIHYTRVAKPDLAIGYGQQLLDLGVSDAELAEIVDDAGFDRDRLDRALERALHVDDLESMSAEIGTRIERGRLGLSRERARIDEAIEMLGGTQRQRMLGEGRLLAAGEYAVPSLLRAVTEHGNERIRIACRKLLESKELARVATMPLCVALPELDPDTQVSICRILGNNSYAHAGPALREMALNDAAAGPVRDAAQRAFEQVLGGDDELTDLYTNLAYNYFEDLGSLVAYPFEDTNNVWSYDAFIGLVAMPVPTNIFNEVMAMQQSEHALELDASNRTALAVYIASNLKRENDMTGTDGDPVYGDRDRSPQFYATVFGSAVCHEVLGLAIDNTDTPLVRDAIEALSHTTGGSSLFATESGRQPLLEALSYPDRRVQYEAAIALGQALPGTEFSGSHRVVPLLASAVRSGDESFALVVSDDEENMKVEVDRLERVGYTVVGADARLDLLGTAIDEAVGVDVVVVRMGDSDQATQTVADLRRMNKTMAAPTLVIASGVDVPRLNREYRGNARTRVTKSVSDQAYISVLEELLERAAGGKLTTAEAEEYAILALDTLRDVAISRSPAYRVEDAENALLEALDVRTGGVRLLVADILALMDSDAAQRALFDAALSSSDSEQVALLDTVATSVKAHGDRAEKRHVLNLINLLETSAGDTADAAARVHGALNLRDSDAVQLIFGGSEG